MHIFIAILIPVLLVTFIVFVGVFMIYMWWRIFKKIGKPGPLSLLVLVPCGELVMLAILAFSKWPIETEVEQHRMRQGMMPPTGYPPQGQPQPPYIQYPSQSPQQHP